jgi:hypothetical protein
MQTILPKKAKSEIPTALDDDHYSQLASDPSIDQFPKGSSYGGSSFTPSVAVSSSAPPQPQMNLTQAGENAAQGADVLVANDNNDWINKKWRPAMGWSYMLTCITDFVIFPVLWSLLQALSKGQVTTQWQPLTLQGAGLYHIAMGAVLGIAAYGRTKEKIEGAAK